MGLAYVLIGLAVAHVVLAGMFVWEMTRPIQGRRVAALEPETLFTRPGVQRHG